MEATLTRREVLSNFTVLLLVPVAGAALGCSSSTPLMSASDDASACNGVFEISTITNNHDHSLCVLTTDLTAPAAAGVTYTTSFNDGHDHTVFLTQAQLQAIEAGDGGHGDDVVPLAAQLHDLEGVTRNAHLLMAATAVVFMASACVPRVDEAPINDPPRPSGPSSVGVEHREPLECRPTTTTPMQRDQGVTRTLRHGTLAQGFNLVTAAALLGIGIANYATATSTAVCPTSGAALDPYSVAAPCMRQQEQQQVRQGQAVGIVISSLAVVPIGLLIWNVFRARDVRETVPAAPEVEAGEWRACDSEPTPLE